MHLSYIFFVYLLLTFIPLLKILNKLSKKTKNIILGIFPLLICISIILIIKPNMKALYTIMFLSSIVMIVIGSMKDIESDVRKIFISYGVILPIVMGLFYILYKKYVVKPITDFETLKDIEQPRTYVENPAYNSADIGKPIYFENPLYFRKYKNVLPWVRNY